MPVSRLTYEETRALGIREINPSPYALDADEAGTALDHLIDQGFPDLKVYLCSALHPWPGDLVGNTIRLFALMNVDEAATLTHEYGHWVWDRIPSEARELYLLIKFGRQVDIAPGLADEVFAEDFRQLFGSPEARQRPHKYDSAEEGWQGLGYALPLVIQEMQGWPERRERLKAIVMDAVVTTEAPEPTKPGASVFSDVAQDRWSRPAIEQARERGLMTGYPDGTFKPGQAVTREELATVVVRLDDRLQQILEQKGVK